MVQPVVRGVRQRLALDRLVGPRCAGPDRDTSRSTTWSADSDRMPGSLASPFGRPGRIRGAPAGPVPGARAGAAPGPRRATSSWGLLDVSEQGQPLLGLAETHPGESRNPLVRLSSGSDRPELLGQSAAGRRRGAGSGPGENQEARGELEAIRLCLGPRTGVIRRSIGEGTGNPRSRRPPPAARRSWYQWRSELPLGAWDCERPPIVPDASGKGPHPGHTGRPTWASRSERANLQGKAIRVRLPVRFQVGEPLLPGSPASLSRPAAASTSPVENWLWIRSVWRSSSLSGPPGKAFAVRRGRIERGMRVLDLAGIEQGLSQVLRPGRGCGGRTGREAAVRPGLAAR